MSDGAQDNIQKFTEEFEELVKKFSIDKYILVLNIDNRDIVLYRPEDLMEITRILKLTHNNFLSQVMQRIGETR